MNLQTIIVFILAGLSCSCNSDSDKWIEIKKTRNIYPSDSISSHDFKAIDLLERRWTNDTYRNYEFKKYCPQKVGFMYETSTPRVRELLSIDTFSIANMLKAALKKEGISHFVGQTLSPEQLNIYFYLEEENSTYHIQDRIEIFNIMTLQSDPEWKFYTTLTHEFIDPKETEQDRIIRTNDIGALVSLINSGYDINSTDEYGRTLLENASIYNRIEIVRLLIDRKAKKYDALELAKQSRDFFPSNSFEPLVKLLTEYNDKP